MLIALLNPNGRVIESIFRRNAPRYCILFRIPCVCAIHVVIRIYGFENTIGAIVHLQQGRGREVEEL